MDFNIEEIANLRMIINDYIEGSATANVDLLESIFHSNALMSGYFPNPDTGLMEANISSPQPFFNMLASAPSTPGDGNYRAEITHLAIQGSTAVATLVENNLFGVNFIDNFQLLKDNGRWQIIAKLFHVF